MELDARSCAIVVAVSTGSIVFIVCAFVCAIKCYFIRRKPYAICCIYGTLFRNYYFKWKHQSISSRAVRWAPHFLLSWLSRRRNTKKKAPRANCGKPYRVAGSTVHATKKYSSRRVLSYPHTRPGWWTASMRVYTSGCVFSPPLKRRQIECSHDASTRLRAFFNVCRAHTCARTPIAHARANIWM